MNNLCYGMKTINITQLPGGSYSHPNYAMDLAGEDTGQDVWRAQGCWKCIASFGNVNTGNTRLFYSCNEKGNPVELYLADGRKSVITIALTHSLKNWQVGKVYKNGEFMYDEGTSGKATGNHIHLEVATGIQETKYLDRHLGVYRMRNEVNPLDVMFVRKDYSTVMRTSLGKDRLKYCDILEHAVPKVKDAVYRLYNPNNSEHMFTANYEEANALYLAGWTYEGVGWIQGKDNEVYRLYNPESGVHMFTISGKEKDALVQIGWKFEESCFKNDISEHVPIYRLYDENGGQHMFTSNKTEKEQLIKLGWKDEGIGFYGSAYSF